MSGDMMWLVASNCCFLFSLGRSKVVIKGIFFHGGCGERKV
jgi:hypothetical protein